MRVRTRRLRSLLRGIVVSPLGAPRATPQQHARDCTKDSRYRSGSLPPFASPSIPAGAESREVRRGSPPEVRMRNPGNGVKAGRRVESGEWRVESGEWGVGSGLAGASDQTHAVN